MHIKVTSCRNRPRTQGQFPLGEGRKDPGRRWSRDLLKLI